MNRVKILDVAFLNADDMENLVNDTIEDIESEDCVVHFLEFHSNVNGRIGTITIEYSDVD